MPPRPWCRNHSRATPPLSTPLNSDDLAWSQSRRGTTPCRAGSNVQLPVEHATATAPFPADSLTTPFAIGAGADHGAEVVERARVHPVARGRWQPLERPRRARGRGRFRRARRRRKRLRPGRRRTRASRASTGRRGTSYEVGEATSGDLADGDAREPANDVVLDHQHRRALVRATSGSCRASQRSFAAGQVADGSAAPVIAKACVGIRTARRAPRPPPMARSSSQDMPGRTSVRLPRRRARVTPPAR